MNIIIYKMEMRRNLKSFFIWALSICGILFFGMLFYPVLNADGLLNQMEGLFENPMMKGLFSAFGADITSLGSLMGFYVTYNSIYNVLLGCIFASVLAGNLLAKEEAEKTAEFLFTRPVSRTSIFFSKAAVLITYITLLSIFYFLVSFLAIEVVKKDSPRLLELKKRDKLIIMEAIESHPHLIYKAFNLTEESFNQYSMAYASNLLLENPSEIQDMNLEMSDMSSLLTEAMENPEIFFDKVLTNPEDYMDIFSIPHQDQEKFLENVRAEEKEYNKMKNSFFTSPEVFLMFFEKNPEIALKEFIKVPGSMEQTVKILELPENMEDRIFKKYNLRKLVVICTYIYLLISSIGSLVLFVSLLVKRGRSILGMALGIVFFFYFLNSLTSVASGLSTVVKIVGFISPFTWMDTDFSSPDFGFSWWRITYFLTLIGISLFAGHNCLKKKNILV